MKLFLERALTLAAASRVAVVGQHGFNQASCGRAGHASRARLALVHPHPYHFTSSTRRFFAFPSSVSFDATGA